MLQSRIAHGNLGVTVTIADWLTWYRNTNVINWEGGNQREFGGVCSVNLTLFKRPRISLEHRNWRTSKRRKLKWSCKAAKRILKKSCVKLDYRDRINHRRKDKAKIAWKGYPGKRTPRPNPRKRRDKKKADESLHLTTKCSQNIQRTKDMKHQIRTLLNRKVSIPLRVQIFARSLTWWLSNSI